MNFSGEHLSYPLAEFMDLAYVIDRSGKTNRTILTDITFNFLGFTQLKCSAENSVRNSSKYVSAETKAIQKSSEITEKKISKYDEAVQSLTALMTQGMGFFKTEEIKEDKSVIFYLHNKERLEDSNIIWKMVGDAFAVSTDGGKTWNAGLDSNGNAVVNVLSAVGINCDWIHSGTLTLGGYNNQNGVLSMQDSSGNEIGRWNNQGVYARGHYVSEDSAGRKIDLHNARIDLYSSGGNYTGHISGELDGIQARVSSTDYLNVGKGYSEFNVSERLQLLSQKQIAISAKQMVVNGNTTKTGTAVFSDGSYLKFVNGYLVGGRTASGTVF